MYAGFAPPTAAPGLTPVQEDDASSVSTIGPEDWKRLELPSGSLSRKLEAPNLTLTWFGAGVLSLLCFIPVWNALRMLSDPIFMYFLGSDIPSMILIVCTSVIAFYVLLLALFFRFAKPEARTEQTMLLIANSFVTLLGVSVLLLAFPLTQAAVSFSTDVMQHCEFGAGLRELHNTSMEMDKLRRDPACAIRISIENCSGYVATEHSEILRAMEDRYRCSGWCVAQAASAGLLQLEARSPWASEEPLGGRPGRGGKLARRALKPEETALLEVGVKYPPTLFSRANFDSSCDGMTARSIRMSLVDVADELFYEGIYLMTVSVLIGFLTLAGACTSSHSGLGSKRPPQSYGAAS